jgi:hypothetical protein
MIGDILKGLLSLLIVCVVADALEVLHGIRHELRKMREKQDT